MAFADSTNVKETSYQLRAYFVPWDELRRKQGTLTASQLQAVDSGITSGFVALIAQNAADINTLRGLVTAQLRLRKVTALPDEGEANVLYLVPDAGADPTSPDQCTEYIWDDDRYEIVGKTSVTPGNGKLTINVNGQAAGSFSADQSTDTTIGITVPLAVSDLQNDSGFQTASDVAAAVAALSAQLAAVAFSGSYDDLTDKPSYPGIGDGTLTIAQNGTQVGSFTANQDTASTINIVTPTKTSDLQNDSGFVDTSDLDTKQDALSEAQLAAVNSGITDTAVAQIEVNRVAIQGKQAQLTQTQLNAVNSGITSGKVALFDAHLADTDAHVTAAQKAAWTAKQDALTEAQMAAVNSGITAAGVQQIADNATAISGKQDALTVAQQAAVDSGATAAKIDQIASNASAIVSLASSKQDSLSTTQLAAVNSGVTAQKVTDYDSHIADADIHVTAAQKAAWNAKQDALNAAQLNAVNSGITSALVTQIGTNQTDISGKANDSDVVHRSGAETIEGPKTFSASQIWLRNDINTTLAYKISFDGITFGTPPASTLTSTFRLQDSGNTIISDIMTQVQSNGFNTLTLRVRNTDGTTAYDRRLSMNVKPNGETNVSPTVGGVFDLGTSSNKWRTLNGVNPGALGMPSNSYVTLDPTNITLDGTYSYTTIDADGWLYLIIRDTSAKTDGELTVYSGTSGTSGNQALYGQNMVCSTDTYARITIPVHAGNRVRIRVNPNGGSPTINGFKLYPCLGNV